MAACRIGYGGKEARRRSARSGIEGRRRQVKRRNPTGLDTSGFSFLAALFTGAETSGDPGARTQ